MPHELGKHPGAVWYKCDFQCHSPRDRAWDGLPELPGGDAPLETARHTWASGFVAQCQALKLGVVSVTDHHDTTFIPYVCKAAENTTVLVLPGIEVTCSDAAQCLALFDPSCGADILSYFIGKLKDVDVAPTTDAKTVPIAAANVTVSDLFREVYSDTRLRDACVLLPHFSDGDAHKHLNEARHNIRFAKLECDGVYIEKKYDELLPDTLKKIYGEIPEWGTRRRGVIPTGDNRQATWDRLGVNDCWIKLGESTIEAVRQALLADEARIAYASPDEPTERVVSIEIKTTLTGPNAVTMTFNPGFNALVGGRGSGKSSILEYLRFGLARTARDFGFSSEREEELINDTLIDGYVAVVIEREGVRETWHRTLDEEKITVFHADGTENYLTLAEARRRFRGRAFHQKQLSTTTKEAESAADQITGIAAAETLDRRRELEQNIKNAQRASTTLLQGAAAYWQTELEYAQSIVRVEDLKKRIANINERMKEGGISPEDLALIASAPLFTRAQSYLGQVKKQIETERARLNAIVTNVLKIPMDQFSEVEIFPELKTLIQGVTQTGTAIAQHMSSALQELALLSRTHEQSAFEFRTRHEEFSRLHAAAVERQKAHKALLDENERLRKELTAAEANAAELAAKLSSAQKAVENFEAAIVKLDGLVTDRRDVLSEAADQVAAKSSGLLKARLKKDPAPVSYISSLTALSEGAGLPDAEGRIRTWIAGQLETDSDNTWPQIREGLLAIYRAKIGAGTPPEPTDEIAELIRQFLRVEGNVTSRQIVRIYTNLNDARVGAVLSATPDDFITMTYVDDGRDMAFSKASPGQQASALLELLLWQSAGTLIIDQPEDDLDNRVIMRIVQLIRTSKNRRQLIFATHNPNLVVNGDADKVIALKSGDPVVGNQPENPRIELFQDGAIETPAVRDAITHIMEGGKDAFDLRSRKYRFDAS